MYPNGCCHIATETGDTCHSTFSICTMGGQGLTLTGFSFPYAISIENTPRRKGSVVISDITTKVVYVYHRGQYTPYAQVTNGVALPTGLLMTRLPQ